MKKKRVRSKAELINKIKTFERLRNDTSGISGSMIYWRTAVSWCSCLWKVLDYTDEQIADFLQFVMSKDITCMKEEERERIRKLLLDKDISWTLINSVKLVDQGNVIDNAVNELAYYNTEKSVDYGLAGFEYLINHGCEKDHINQMFESLAFLDSQDTETIDLLSHNLKEELGIIIALDEEKPEGAQEISLKE